MQKTITFDNMTVRVHSPDLTVEERTKRMQQIHNTASNLLKDYLKKKEQTQ
jgi:hypothetical protein